MKKVLLSVFIGVSLFAFNNIQNGVQNRNTYSQNIGQYVLKGKVIKAYIKEGFGPRGYKWLFMDVDTNKGIVHVGIAPVFVLSNLPINEGDIVEVNGFTPRMWPENTLKAWDIYDVTQKKDYSISPCNGMPRYRWR